MAELNNQDDDLLPQWDLLHVPNGLAKSQPNQNQPVAKPVIRAITDTSTLFHCKHSRHAQNLTCMVSVELPTQYPFRPRTFSLPNLRSSSPHVPPPISTLPPPSVFSHVTTASTPTTSVGITSPSNYDRYSPTTAPSSTGSLRSNSYSSSCLSSQNHLGQPHPIHHSNQVLQQNQASPALASPLGFQFTSPEPFTSAHSPHFHSDFASPLIKSFSDIGQPQQPDSLTEMKLVFQDLINRVRDWKGHSPHDFGSLKAQGRVQVEKESSRRDFVVYLFEEALLCILEDKSKMGPDNKPKLKLKGRVYIRHMSKVMAQDDEEGGLSLKVKMEDENLDAFVMKFNSAHELESWRVMIQDLLDRRNGNQSAKPNNLLHLPEVPPQLGNLHQSHYQPPLAASRPSTVASTDTWQARPIYQPSLNSAHPRSINSPYQDFGRPPQLDATSNFANGSENGYASSVVTNFSRTPQLSSGGTLSSVGEEKNYSANQVPQSRFRSVSTSRVGGAGQAQGRHGPTSLASFSPSLKSPQLLHQPSQSQIKQLAASIKFLPHMNPNLTKSMLPKNTFKSAPNPRPGTAIPTEASFSTLPVEPIDLCLILSIPISEENSFAPNSNQLKLKLLKQSLQFLIHHLHPRSRLSFVIYTVGCERRSGKFGFQLKSTPFLSLGDPRSFKRLEFVIEQIARSGDPSKVLDPSNLNKYTSPFLEGINLDRSSSGDKSTSSGDGSIRRANSTTTGYNKENETNHNGDIDIASESVAVQIWKWTKRLKMVERKEEKVSVVSAVNLALDMVLQRKQKNDLSGLVVLNDGRDLTLRTEMSLVMARAEVANIPIHTIGWGKSHQATTLWQLSNHTGGNYTFVKDWYSIKEALAGVVGGILSAGIIKARVRVSVPEGKWFKIKRVAGASSVVLSANGQHAEVEFNELRYGERRDFLLEMEMRAAGQVLQSPTQSQYQQDSQNTTHSATALGLSAELNSRVPMNKVGNDQYYISQIHGVGTGLDDVVDLEDPHRNLMESGFEEMNEEVPLMEIDASYRDPRACKEVTRLPRPVCLCVSVVSTNEPSVGFLGSDERGSKSEAFANKEPRIFRRKMELLTSESLSRASLLVSRRMDWQALKLLNETSLIILKAIQNNYGVDLSGYSPALISSSEQKPHMNGKYAGLGEETNGTRTRNAILQPHLPYKTGGMRSSGTYKRSVDDLEGLLVLGGCLEIIDAVNLGIEEIERGLKEIELSMPQGGDHFHESEMQALAAARELRIHKVYQKFDTEMKSWIGEQSGILRDQRSSLISDPEPVLPQCNRSGSRINDASNVPDDASNYNEADKIMSADCEDEDELIGLWILALNRQRVPESSVATPSLSSTSSASSNPQVHCSPPNSFGSQQTMKGKKRLGAFRSNKPEKVYFNSDYGILLRNLITSWTATD